MKENTTHAALSISLSSIYAIIIIKIIIMLAEYGERAYYLQLEADNHRRRVATPNSDITG